MKLFNKNKGYGGLLFSLWKSGSSILFFGFFSTYVNAEKITVITEYLPPFQVKNNDGSLGGYATEVVNELFVITNDEAHVEVLPWARGYDRALIERNTLIFSIAHTKERHSLFHWIGALRYERFFFWGLKSQFSEPFIDINQLKDISVASPKGHNSEQYLTSKGFNNIYRVVKSDQQVQMLYRHRVDMVLGNSLIIKSQAEELGHNPNDLMPLFEASDLSNSLDIAFSKNTDTKLVKRYQEAFQLLVESGKLAQIQKKWSIVDDISTFATIEH